MAKKAVAKKKSADAELEDDDLDNEDEEENSELENEDDENSEGLSKKGKGKSKDKPDKEESEDDEEDEDEDEDEEEEEDEESEEEVEDKPDFLPKGFKVPKELQGAYKQMQSGFNKKLTEFDKKYKGKKVIGDYEELLKDDKFLSWAEQSISNAGKGGAAVDLSQFSMDEVVQNWGRLPNGQKRAYWGSMQPNDKEMFKVKLQLSNITQTTYASKEASLEAEVTKKYENYGDYKDPVKKLRTEIARNPYLHHDEAFKILDYEAFGKRMLKQGLLEGRKGVKKSKEEFVDSQPGSKGNKGKKKAKTVREAWDQAEEDEE